MPVCTAAAARTYRASDSNAASGAGRRSATSTGGIGRRQRVERQQRRPDLGRDPAQRAVGGGGRQVAARGVRVPEERQAERRAGPGLRGDLVGPAAPPRAGGVAPGPPLRVREGVGAAQHVTVEQRAGAELDEQGGYVAVVARRRRARLRPGPRPTAPPGAGR